MNLSGLYSKALKRIHKYGLLDTTRLAFHVAHGLADYYLNPTALRGSRLPVVDSEKICREMAEAGLEVVSYRIDVPAFFRWLDHAKFPDFYIQLYGSAFYEKALEHFVGAQLLAMSKGSVLIDVAASESPWMNIAPRLYGVTAIALDLKAPSFFVSGNKVVADATRLPFPNASIDSMALHCAYEMFEGESDSLLIPEASRALRIGGRLVILPLYMHHLYYVDSSPGTDRRNISYQGAKRVWREEREQKIRLGGIRFSRKYDVPAFMNRVARFKGEMNLRILYIENEKEVDPTCYLKFVAVFQK